MCPSLQESRCQEGKLLRGLAELGGGGAEGDQAFPRVSQALGSLWFWESHVYKHKHQH